MRRGHLHNILAAFATVISLVMLSIVVVFCIRAQYGSNDYVEWSSKDIGAPPDRSDNWTTWNDEQWAKWTAAYEHWDRRQWRLHVRANRNAIVAFGRQPFYGYPANSFDVHFYYWILIPILLIWPVTWTALLLKQSSKRVAGAVPCPDCGYDLRATPKQCPECGFIQSP